MKLDNAFLDELLEKAVGNERRRMNFDLRNGSEDGSQRMLNAILPESVVPVHRLRTTNETVVCLRGSLTEMFYEEEGKESAQYELYPGEMLQIPKGVWHTVVANVPSVIFEAKDGKYQSPDESDIWTAN